MTDALTCPQCDAELPSNAPAGICPRCLMQAALADSSDENLSSADSPYAVTTPQPRSFLPPESRVLAEQFPHLEILELLGQGGMGAVYKARQPKLDRMVALKVIRPESADDPTFAERFNREAKTLARLNHPNIVGVHDFGEVTVSNDESGDLPKTLYYFLMEYVDGANLRQMMEREELKPDRALTIAPQICDALQFAHDEGIVHRDIKPENILIDSRGRVKIADFGLAKLASPSEQDFTLTGTHQVMGTPRYMAPEQMAGSRAVDHRADLYSLGVVFYEMLTGQIPAGHFSPPSQHAAIDVRLDDVVMKTLAPNPEDRFQSASQIQASLDAISKSESSAFLSEPEQVPARGFSTIFEREVGAAWNWVAHPEQTKKDSEKTEVPAFPRLLFITLAVLGGLTIFLPWAALEIEKGSRFDLTNQYDSSTLAEAVSESYRGTEIWSSSAAAGICFLIAVVLILTPQRRNPGWISVGLMSLFSIVTLVHTVFYPSELKSRGFVTLQVETTPQIAEALKPAGAAGVGYGTQVDSEDRVIISRELSLWNMMDQVKYCEGYFAAMGISVTLILLNIVAVRNLILNREPKSESSESWSGTPLASLRFQVPVRGDIGSKIKFHFLGMGYELADEQPGTWIFQRGTVMGGMMGTNIRVFPTRLSVHAIRVEEGGHLINCHWSVRLMGGFATSKESHKLEEEGRELQSLLAGKGDQPQTVTPFPAEAGTPQGSVLQPGGEARIASAEEEQNVAWSPTMDLSAIEDEVRDPAMAMMVVGLLMVIGHVLGFIAMVSSYHTDDYSWIPLPGILIGMAMLAGSFGLKGLRSQSWTQVGIIVGFLPLSPAWIITVMVSIWAGNVLSKPQVKKAFVERRQQRREEQKRWSSDSAEAGAAIDLAEIEDEISAPAIAMVTVGLLMMVGHGIWAIKIFQPGGLQDDMAVFCLPGMLIGLAMLVGGLCMKGLGSRGWAQMGAIAGMIPLHPGWLLALPVGIWANVTLRKPNVRRAFLERARQRREPPAVKATSPVLGSSENQDLDLIAVEEEVSGPALSLMVVGLLILIGHSVYSVYLLRRTNESAITVLLIPGFVVGIAMLVGGSMFKRLRSRGWVQLGIFSGMLPLNGAYLISIPLCLWANSVFRRPEVKQAFLERARRSRLARSEGSRGREGEPTIVRSWTVIVLVVWSLLVVIGGMASYAWLRNELSVTQIVDNRAGTLVPKSGAYEQVTVTAKGIGRTKLLLDESAVERTQLEFQLKPLKYSEYQGGTGFLQVDLPVLGWRSTFRDGTQMGSPTGLSPDVIQEWMGQSGVDLNTEGVREEARALFRIAEFAHQKPPHELVDETFFTVTPGAIRKITNRYEEWQHARYCLYLWLGGLAIILLVTVPRGETAPNSLGRTLLQFVTMIMILAGVTFLLYLAGGVTQTKTEPTQGVADQGAASPDSTSKLRDAAAKGDGGRVKELLDAGASVNDKDADGQTPLMIASKNGHASLAATLMLLGANVNEKDKQGMTPMMYAVENGHEPVRKAIEEVIKASQIAKKEERIEKLKQLPGIDKRLISGLQIDVEKIEFNPLAQDNEGETVLMKAVKSQNFAYLRDAEFHHGPAASTYEVASLQDKYGRTALMHAILLKDPDFIRRIYEVNLDDVHVTETNGFIPEYKLNPLFDPRALSRSSKDGLTALQLAEKHGQDETANLIRDEMERIVELATKPIERDDLELQHKKDWLILRGHAYRALGEQEKAVADFQQARQQS